MVASVLIIVFIFNNAWKYGIKQGRFKQACLLTAFYVLSLVTMILYILMTLNYLRQTFVWSKVPDLSVYSYEQK
jgi:hypothetical protein